MLNFSTTNSTFRQLLGNGLTYRVPAFQRDYSWTEEEWEDLWEDILGLFAEDGEPAHYLSYLVLQSTDSKNFAIIDGQQRITTVSILILACLGQLKELVAAGLDAEHNAKRREQFQHSYIGYLDPVTLISRPKLNLNRHNDAYYQNYLVPLEKLPQRGLKAPEHQLRKAFGWFTERIKSRHGLTVESGTKIAEFLDSLVDKLFFTVITVSDELNAFKVFETLNARGVRLSSTDLLKNYLFSVISANKVHDVELKNLEDRWERIVGLLESESFPEFLRVFWNSRNRLVRKTDLFKTIRRKIVTREQAFEIIRDMDQCAAIYAALRDANDPSWSAEEKRALGQLSMFMVRQPLAMLLASHVRFYESDRATFTQILQAVTVLSFRYNVICNLPTHEQERLYNAIAQKVSNGTYGTGREILQALREIYPDDQAFKTAFAAKILRTTDSRNKRVARYILFEIERQQSGQDFDFESATYTLEHILPEHPNADWAQIDEAKQDQLIYRLGNLTPLEANKNRGLGNRDYATKRAIYPTSAFRITQAVAEHYDTWDEAKLEARQKQLAKVATSIWRIAFGD